MLGLLLKQHEQGSDFGMPLHITVGSLMVSKSNIRVLNLDVLYVSFL